MNTQKAYELLEQAIELLDHNGHYELAEVASMALESLYENAMQYEKMMFKEIEKQEDKLELQELRF